MSWGAHKDSLLQTKCMEKVAIYGLDGTLWTASDAFNVSPAEIQVLVAGFSNGATLASTGFKLNGEKFMYITSDDSQIQGKKSVGGASIAKSKMALLIGVYGEKMAHGNCRKEIEKMKDYLLGVGY